jgi:hypothetical protein
MSYAHKYFDEVEVTSRLLNIILDMSATQQFKILNSLDKSGCQGSRQHARMNAKNPWIIQVDTVQGVKSDEYVINDISRSGMFIESSSSFFVGQNIAVKFQIPVSKKIFQMIVEIVRLQDNGIGVKFKRQL